MTDALLLESYLSGQLPANERILFEARLLVEEPLKQQLAAQQHLLELVKAFGRERLRAQIKAAEVRVFTQSRYARFQKHLTQLFQR